MIDNLRSPLNYAGNKTRLLPLIHQYLPQDYSVFVDAFAGSGVVGCSQDSPTVLLNEKDTRVLNLVRTIYNTDLDYILDYIDELHEMYNLGKNNKQEYINFRQCFNSSWVEYLDDQDINFKRKANIKLLTLIFYSFNHFCTFNRKGEFTTPSGYKRSSYNKNIKESLIKFKHRIDEVKPVFTNLDYRDLYDSILVNTDNNIKDYMFFFDPVYMISDDTYTRTWGITWSEQDEIDMYDVLEDIDKRGGKFMLINQLQKGDIINEFLLDFSNKFKTINTKETFTNSSYQHKRKTDKEIMVINY